MNKHIEDIVEEVLTSSSGLPYGITIGFNQDVLGQRQGFQKYGGDELRQKLKELLTTMQSNCFCKEKGVIELIEEEREHVKQTILIKLLPHITDHQREMLVEILKEV